jgi:hypothetical protein
LDGVTWHLASTEVVATGVAAGPGEYVAFDRSKPGADLWVSVGGTDWTLTPLDETVFTRDDSVSAVVYGDNGYVAVGEDLVAAAVWTSPDGATWNRVPFDGEVFRGSIHDVAYGDAGYVAVGAANNGDLWAEAVVWTSPDGLTWNRVPNENGVFGGVGGHVMYGVTYGAGRYVAVGVEGDPEVDSLGAHAAVWTSTDGVNWTRVPHDEEVFGFHDQETEVAMDDVAHSGAGYVAVGDALGDGEDRAAAVWYSSDGVTWQRVAHDEALFGGEIGLNAVAAIGPNWVAVSREVAISWTWESPR